MSTLTKEQFINKLVADEIQNMNCLSKIDVDEKSQYFFLVIGNMLKTFDVFGIEKPDFLVNESWTIHDEIVEHLVVSLADLKENHTDDGRG